MWTAKSTAGAPNATCPVLDHAPFKHLTVDLRSENNKWHLSHVMTMLHGCPYFEKSSEVSHL